MENFHEDVYIKGSNSQLDELSWEVERLLGTLAGGEKIALDKGSKALRALRTTQVSFANPYSRLVHLTPALFETVGATVSELEKLQMEQTFDFYYLSLSVSMKPERGVQFSRVECQLDFTSEGKDSVIVHTLFPSSEWKEVIHLGGGLNIGLSADLSWKAGLDAALPQKVLNKLPASVKANIENKNDLKAFIALSDFNFKLGRSEIAATGEDNSFAFWRIEKPELKQTQTARFGIVFKVPKGTRQLEMLGTVDTYPSMPWLTADLGHVIAFLSKPFQALFQDKEEKEQEESLKTTFDSEKWLIELARAAGGTASSAAVGQSSPPTT